MFALLALYAFSRSESRHASSPAHQLTSSPASRSRLPIVVLVILGLAVVFLASGCQANATVEGATSSVLVDQLEFDTGVIFAGESNYLCIPFERLGLALSAQITSIETSCECVEGSVVCYLTPNKNTARAVRLDFAPEPRSENSEFVPMLLSVQVVLEIESAGDKQIFSVNLVHSVQDMEKTALHAGVPSPIFNLWLPKSVGRMAEPSVRTFPYTAHVGSDWDLEPRFAREPTEEV